MARDHGGRVRPRDQGRQSEKRRFSAESGGVHRGGASGHGRYGQKHPGRGAAVANEPCFFRLSGQLETLGILFYASYHTDQSVRSNTACNRPPTAKPGAAAVSPLLPAKHYSSREVFVRHFQKTTSTTRKEN